MDIQLISTIADFLIRFGGGLVATLVGFRLIGPKPGANADTDFFHRKWGKHLKWLGPLLWPLLWFSSGVRFGRRSKVGDTFIRAS